MHLLSRKLVLILMILAFALQAAAQNGIIRGRVVDDQGKPVTDALVSIQPLDPRSRHCEVKTDSNGLYVCMGLSAGDYRVIARAPGFAPSFLPSVKSSTQPDNVADIILTPGSDQKLPFELSAREVEDVTKEMEKAERRKKVASDVQALFDSGLKLAQEGRHVEAIEEFRKALEKDPEQANILGYMADSYAKLNRNDEALDLYRRAIAIKPDEAAFYTNMGVLLSNMGKEEESQEAFKRAVALNPEAAQNYYNIGATLFNNGHTVEAAEAFRKAIEKDPKFEEAYYQLGMCLASKRETMPEAIETLKKYLEIGKKPDQIEAARQVITALEQSVRNQ